MPTFDPSLFMQQTVDAPMETEYTLVPEGEYKAMIDDFNEDAVEQFEFEYKRGPKAGQNGSMMKLTLPFVIDDDKVKAELARDKVTVTKQLILDLDTNGGLDRGKNRNIDLGRIRDAVGQNAGGPWNISNLRGAGPLVVKVVHREFDYKDGRKGKRAEVDRVARIV